MNYSELIAKLLGVSIWPVIVTGFSIYIFIKTENFKRVWEIIWQPFKGAQIELYGQKFTIYQETLANVTEIISQEISLIDPLTQDIPYANHEIINNIVTKVAVLESFGLKVDQMNNYMILCCFGGYHYQNFKFTEALKYYNLALSALKKERDKYEKGQFKSLNSGITNCIGWCYRRLCKYDLAIESFELSTQKEEDNPWPYLGMSMTYHTMYKELNNDYKNKTYESHIQNANKAEQYFKAKIAKNITDYLPYCGLAQLYYHLEKYSDSIQLLDVAISLRKDLALAYYNRSLIKCAKILADNKLFSEEAIIAKDHLFHDAMIDLVTAIAYNPILRQYANKDSDFKRISSIKCFGCLVKPEFFEHEIASFT